MNDRILLQGPKSGNDHCPYARAARDLLRSLIPVAQLTETAMLPTAIIDPALGKTCAHNLGFAELLSRQAAEPGRFGVWCSKSADDELLGRLGEGGEAIAPIFTADFYQIIGKAGGVADHWD